MVADRKMNKDNNIKVAVLAGGISSEREISLQSGSTIASALKEAGAEVVLFDVAPDRLSILDDESVDVFFPALHGEFGEDGKLQEILESRGLCYTGSGPVASRCAMDKLACKEMIASKTDVAVAWHTAVSEGDNVESITQRLSQAGEKFAVKPISQGSSIGVEITQGRELTAETALKTFAEFGECMIEEFIEGSEITSGVVDGKALPIIEIRSKTGFYDYHAKYVDDATEYLFDTIDDSGLVEWIGKMAIDCFIAAGCRHWGRVDFILSKENVPYFLEINTLPGFTSHSLLPMAAAKAGASRSELCMKIVEAAVRDFEKGTTN
jgi:D-alanine-D-alanine ligase